MNDECLERKEVEVTNSGPMIFPHDPSRRNQLDPGQVAIISPPKISPQVAALITQALTELECLHEEMNVIQEHGGRAHPANVRHKVKKLILLLREGEK